MTNMQYQPDRRRSGTSENGQVSIFVLLALGFFLLGFVGFAVDMTNLWFHRQTAQGAADAACTAGIMDVLVRDEGGSVGAAGNFPVTLNGGFDCAGTTYSPCRYAAMNGYNGAGLVAGAASNDVAVSFPSTVANPIPPSMQPPGTMVPAEYLQVDVTDRVRLTFASIISKNRTSDVRARAVCGIVLATVPIPIIIMNPTCPQTFDLGGNSSLNVVGGPPQSIEVNSIAPNAATIGTVNFSIGGPNFTGSNFGTYGGPPPTPGGFSGGSTGSWVISSPISDPFFNVPFPGQAGGAVPIPPAPVFKLDGSEDDAAFNACAVPTYRPTPFSCKGVTAPCIVPGPIVVGGKEKCAGWQGCPDVLGCAEYKGGLYPSAIDVKKVKLGVNTAIFDPGLYYITGTVPGNCAQMPNGACWRPNGQCRYGLALESNSMVRPSTAPGDGSQGTTFYLSGTGPGNYGSVYVDANSGTQALQDTFPTSKATCTGGTPPDARLGLPPNLTGNVLLGPCTGPGGLLCLQGPTCADYGSEDGKTRGILLWDNRDNADLHGQPSFQGGGQMLIAGTMYFHNCASKDGAGLGTNCQQPMTGYNGFVQLQGQPGSSTDILGFIVTDDLSEGGTANVTMSIDPNKTFPVLKATLVQ